MSIKVLDPTIVILHFNGSVMLDLEGIHAGGKPNVFLIYVLVHLAFSILKEITGALVSKIWYRVALKGPCLPVLSQIFYFVSIFI